MDYVTPPGQAPGSSYIDCEPSTGVEGSVVTGASIEHSMREILNAITDAGLSPDPDDLTQLAQAIQVMIGGALSGYALRSELGRPILAGEPVYLAGPYLPKNHVWPDRSLILFKDWPELHQRYLAGVLGVATTATDKANFPGAFAISDDGKGLYLPNLGGYFIRAWQPSQTVDAGRKSGNAQGDAIRNITGTLGSGHIFPFQQASGALAVAVPGTLQGTPLASASNLYANITLDASRTVPTAAENRPTNISVPLAIYLGKPVQEA